MNNPFKTLTVRDKLVHNLHAVVEARIEATARVAYWHHRETFLRAELERITAELAEIDGAEVLSVGLDFPVVALAADHSR